MSNDSSSEASTVVEVVIIGWTKVNWGGVLVTTVGDALWRDVGESKTISKHVWENGVGKIKWRGHRDGLDPRVFVKLGKFHNVSHRWVSNVVVQFIEMLDVGAFGQIGSTYGVMEQGSKGDNVGSWC